MSDFYLNNIKYNKEAPDPLSYEYEWVAPGSGKILMTVALPLRKMGDITWMALESLRRQETSVNWELIMFEDGGESREVLDTFVGKLPGCKRILYKSIDPKKDGRVSGRHKGAVLLIDKWIGMALAASNESVGYILHAGDDYAPKRMIDNHFKNLQNKNCIYSTYPRGVFYHYALKKRIFYNGYAFKSHGKDFLTNIHLHNAVRTEDVRKIRPSYSDKERNALIDKYIRVNIYRNRGIDPTENKYIYNVDDIDSTDWMTGFNTDGLNTISYRRKIYNNPEARSAVWSSYNDASKKTIGYCGEFDKNIPKNVYRFISSISKSRKNR
ncbi:hypothetical protein CMI47_03280 [Candidatus Pacearchaeota archaeon]|nr:hypothetical protein [Candidatus Pacearchaeota archaeon]